jgi:hypothetical protein
MVKLADLSDQLVEIADRSATMPAGSNRGALELKFGDLVREYENIRDGTTASSVDLLDKSELGGILEDAGIDTDSASTLALAFQALVTGDGSIGFAYVAGKSASVVNPATGQRQTAAAVRDPLDNHVSNKAKGRAADYQLGKFRDVVHSNLEKINAILEEILGAQNFALQGVVAVEGLSSSISSYSNAESVAAALSAAIRSSAKDNALSAHSSLDSLLAKELLAD